MLSKQCPFCKEFSYSSCSVGLWICPKCGKDITSTEFVDPIAREKIGDKTNLAENKKEHSD